MSAFGGKADMAFCADLRFAVAIRGKMDMTLCGAGQAPRGVPGGHKRDGIDDPVRELRFTFRTEIFLVIVQQSCCFAVAHLLGEEVTAPCRRPTAKLQ